jgi:hypothetical protein
MLLRYVRRDAWGCIHHVHLRVKVRMTMANINHEDDCVRAKIVGTVTVVYGINPHTPVQYAACSRYRDEPPYGIKEG